MVFPADVGPGLTLKRYNRLAINTILPVGLCVAAVWLVEEGAHPVTSSEIQFGSSIILQEVVRERHGALLWKG